MVADKAAGKSFYEALDDSLQQTDWHGRKLNNIEEYKAKVIDALRWDEGLALEEAFCRDGMHHFIAPSFFKTMTELTRKERSFTVVLRTFGTDLEEVKTAVNAFAEGRHPRQSCWHPGCSALTLPSSQMWLGRYGMGAADGSVKFSEEDNVDDVSNSCFALRQLTIQGSSEEDGHHWETDEERVLLELELRNQERGIVACADHYHWWRNNNYIPSAGKPLWITQEDDDVHHIFFDDNIHNCSYDSIVAVRWRQRAGDPFRPLSGEETRALHGLHTVRVQSCEAYIDEDYFLKRIAECEAEWARQRQVDGDDTINTK